MQEIQYNETTTIAFEHIPILASANTITGTKYFTKLYLVTPQGRYPVGEIDEKLDEEAVKSRFAEFMHINQERQYGQTRPMLRKELPTKRSTLNRGIAGSIRQLAR